MEKRLGLYQKAVIGQEEIMRQNRQGSPAIVSSRTNTKSFLNNKRNVSNKDTVAFSGLTSTSIREGFNGFKDGAKKFPEVFIKGIEAGGFFAEFCTLDFIGMIVPRTWQAFNRNTEELGHMNYKAGIEEAIREFLTGPSMFFIPMMMLSNAPKLFGEASSIDLNTQNHFNKTLTGLVNKETNGTNDLKHQFYDNLLDEMLEKHSIKTVPHKGEEVCVKSFIKDNLNAIENTQAEYASKLKNLSFAESLKYKYRSTAYSFNKFMKEKIYDKLRSKSTDKKIEIKDPTTKGLVELLEKIDEHKKNIADITEKVHEVNGINLQRLETVAVGKDKKGDPINHKIKNLTDDMVNYAKDVIKQVSEHSGNKIELLEKIANFKRGGRVIVSTLTLATTAAFLYCVPKFYQRNKQFPGIEGLNEAYRGNSTPNNISEQKVNNMKEFLNSARRAS